MKWFYVCAIAILFLTSCGTAQPTPTATPLPTVAPTSTSAPTATSTPLPTATPTATSAPSATPLPTRTATLIPREITAADVGLPWDPQVVKPIFIPCHFINTAVTPPRFHAGDGIVFSEKPGQTYNVLAPADGKILSVDFVNAVGYEVTLETNLYRQGKRVYIDLVHTSGLVNGLRTGMTVNREQPLLVLDRHWGGGGLPDLFLDIGIRNGPKGASPLSRNFAPLSYFSFLSMIQDDIANLPQGDVKFVPFGPYTGCLGTQVPDAMLPRLTPTP